MNPTRDLARELTGLAETTARLRGLLDLVRDQVEALEERGKPQDAGRVAARRLLALPEKRRLGPGASA